MQTDDLMADTRAFRAAGVEIDDPSPLSRVRPDGYKLEWVLSIPRGAHKGVAPFLIQDGTPRGERVPHQTVHVNAVAGIGTVTVAVDDVAPVSGWYAAALGRPGVAASRDDLGAAGVRFGIGPHTMEFVAPTTAGSPLREWLARRGASPWAATLRTGPGARGALDPAQTMGARLSYA